jgi:hypothetical protein
MVFEPKTNKRSAFSSGFSAKHNSVNAKINASESLGVSGIFAISLCPDPDFNPVSDPCPDPALDPFFDSFMMLMPYAWCLLFLKLLVPGISYSF